MWTRMWGKSHNVNPKKLVRADPSIIQLDGSPGYMITLNLIYLKMFQKGFWYKCVGIINFPYDRENILSNLPVSS